MKHCKHIVCPHESSLIGRRESESYGVLHNGHDGWVVAGEIFGDGFGFVEF